MHHALTRAYAPRVAGVDEAADDPWYCVFCILYQVFRILYFAFCILHARPVFSHAVWSEAIISIAFMGICRVLVCPRHMFLYGLHLNLLVLSLCR